MRFFLWIWRFNVGIEPNKRNLFLLCQDCFGLGRVGADGDQVGLGAGITKNILLGKSTPAQRTAAVLNAGAAIYVAIDGLSLKDAMQKAQDVIDDGSAYKKLQAFIRITNEEDDQ